jgi:hypothetical protein
MAGSNWNTYLDLLLEADLNVAEHRLALALGRLLLGSNRREAALGERLLYGQARLTRSRFVRARQGLVEKGLLDFEPGRRGRGQRATYRLPLPEKRALQRANEKRAPERANPSAEKARTVDTEKRASERARIGSGRGKNSQTLQARAVSAYRSAGGSLELTRDRLALVRSVKLLVDQGADDELILAACGKLGRERTFPGYLKQAVAELRQQGGVCAWNGLDRLALSTQQLSKCTCKACAESLAYRDAAETVREAA